MLCVLEAALVCQSIASSYLYDLQFSFEVGERIGLRARPAHQGHAVKLLCAS